MPISSSTTRLSVADHYVIFVAAHAVPEAMTMSEIEEATAKDETLQEVIQSFRQTHWNCNNVQLKPYERLHHELSITESGVVLRGHRIVMPSVLREKPLKVAHHGHQGMVKMKELLRTKVWWPNIDKQVEEYIKACLPCQATGLAKPPTPLCITETLSSPWTHLHMDFCGPFPTGESIFVIIDSYSKFPEVEIMKETTAPTVITKEYLPLMV